MNKKTTTQWLISDELWQKMEPLLPVPKTHHPLGCHRHRVDNWAAMNAIFHVLRTGCPWNALNATGICSSSSAHRRFQEWLATGVFERFWQNGLLTSEKIGDIDLTKLDLDKYLPKTPPARSKKQKIAR
ncbi:transposase [Xenorhabdus bovienii str. kraussei Quebec]|uniref:Transposase n=1 Tax=Xenorhabdus bovienii str. kraussei Quebec TaxID=1398203 RepID=A0A077PJI5_XENBV|nr:transposase [Xenorhabdus bovienii str. kraussei Quebec]